MHQRYRWEAFSVGETGFCKVSLCRLRVVRVTDAFCHTVNVPEDSRAGERLRGALAALQDEIDQGLSVDRRSERLTHERVVERVFLVVEPVVVRAEIRSHRQLEAKHRVSLYAIHVLKRRGRRVQHPSLVHEHRCGGLFDHVTVDLIDLDSVRIVERGALVESHVALVDPCAELISTVGGNVLGLGPVIAVLFHDESRERAADPHSSDGREVSRRLIECEFDRVVTNSSHADAFSSSAFVVVECLRALDDPKHIGVRRPGGRVKGSLNTVHHVMRGYSSSVFCPVDVVTQIERPGEPVCGVFPMRCKLRYDFHRCVIEIRQTEEKCLNNLNRRCISCDVGIQRWGFCS